ncbi:MAG: right-handed parallel beta-helix repeat-containing protein [Candidatus Bathyarchaeota archaeon]|nr:right-handed parallel beta-helix repeat-containing protein [Candidatus Bathyarchaeota archaeon]
MRKKLLTALLFATLACGLLFVSGSHVVKADAKTITVPDDYSSIQAAVGNATAGDTVFVRKGTYRESVEIDKSLSLIGEDSQSTVIVGKRLSYGSPPPIIEVWRNTPNVTISGFTLTDNDAAGIWIDEDSYNCTVKGNIITNNWNGIHTFSGVTDPITGLGKPANILIFDNYVTNNKEFGVYCSTPNTTISSNTIAQNGWNGVIVDSSFDVTVSRNIIKENGLSGSNGFLSLNGGLNLRNQGSFDVYGNDIIDNQGYGIQFGEVCNNASVHENNIKRNLVGVELLNYFIIPNGSFTLGSGNLVYQNNLINNSEQVVIQKESGTNENNYLNGTNTVSWDNGTVGNYWSDYQTKYPNATEVDATGIGNTPYVIDANNIDHYPLMKVVAVPEFAPWIILPLAAATIIMLPACLLLKRRLNMRF